MKTFWGKHHYLFAPLGALIVCFPLLFSVLDNKIFDLFLRLVPSLTEDDRVHIITVDDASIEYAGGFPFPRDAMADAIILLEELGVATIVFDLNYLDPSPVRLHPDFERGDFPRYVESPDEVLRDAAAYFAEAIAFTDSTWLTLTFSGRGENQTAGSPPGVEPDMETFLQNTIALKNVKAENDTLTASWAGVMPAIPVLLKNAKGAGFVNAGPDEDGYRRRVDLLATYNGSYYGQLAFTALLDMMEDPADPVGSDDPAGPGIEVSNSTVVVRNVLMRGTRRDITIPRAEDGSVLLKWPKKPFHDYRVRPLFDFLQYVKIESALVENFSLMENSGFFSYWDDETPPDKFRAASYLKELIQEERAYGELETWRRMREDFFENSRAFLASDCQETLLADIGGDAALGAYVQNLFRVCREQFTRMDEIRTGAKIPFRAFCTHNRNQCSHV